MRKINIWFLHHYASLPNLNGYIRPYNFSRFLKDKYNFAIIASSYQHFSGDNLINDKKKFLINDDFAVPFIFIKTPKYKSTLERVKNLFSFYFGVLKNASSIEKKIGKPDIIIASSPHLLALLCGLKLAKKYHCQCISEVRDLWPEAIFYSNKKVKEKSLLGRYLKHIEYNIYKKSDAIIFTKEGDTDYLLENNYDIASGGKIDLQKCFYINNGVDLKAFKENATSFASHDDGFSTLKKNIVYAGTIRPTNNVGVILDAAEILRNNNEIVFSIYGDGNQLEMLKQRVIDKNLTNVKFYGFVNRDQLPSILSNAYVNLLNYTSTNYNWSRGNSSNKLFEYMAAGKPIIATMQTNYSLISRYKIGVELNKSDGSLLADAILKICALDNQDYLILCENAENAARDFDYSKLSQKLNDVIKYVLDNNNDKKENKNG